MSKRQSLSFRSHFSSKQREVDILVDDLIKSPITANPPYEELHKKASALAALAELDDSTSKKVVYSVTRTSVFPKLIDNLLRIGDYIPPEEATMFNHTGSSNIIQFLAEDETRRKTLCQKGLKVFFDADKTPDHGAMGIKVIYALYPDDLAECGAASWAWRMVNSNKVGERVWGQAMDLYGTVIKFSGYVGNQDVVDQALNDEFLLLVKIGLELPVNDDETTQIVHKGALEFLRGFTAQMNQGWNAKLVGAGLITPIARIFVDKKCWIVSRALALEVLAGLTDTEKGKEEILTIDAVIEPCVSMLSKLPDEDRIEMGRHFTSSSQLKPAESAADLLFKLSSSPALVPALEARLSSPKTFAEQANIIDGMDEMVKNSTAAASLIKAGLIPFLFKLLDTSWDSALASVDGSERRVLRAKSLALGCLVIMTHQTPQVPQFVKEALETESVEDVLRRVSEDGSNPPDIKGMVEEVLGRLKPGAPDADGYMLMLRN